MTDLAPHFNHAYQCPICGEPLIVSINQRSYSCSNRHSFDCAKEGYINLLPVQQKHSKEPGDNKVMLDARRLFLEASFYEPLAKAIALIINAIQTPNQPANILDLGCGEGYYTRKISELCQSSALIKLFGNDISKFAISAAAKKQKSAQFIVASSNKLPYVSNFFDVVIRVFAPSEATELCRIIKTSGYLITVTPGPRHLWQIKEHIYTNVKEHTEDAEIPDGFTQLSSQRISYKISPNAEQRAALLQMTPFAWSASEEIKAKLNALDELNIETDFIVTLSLNTSQ
ncbi:MAG: 23S rRNA (guanine(745)-N(1))-methyltransferase [Methylococcales bacterium]|nr:23S rRNA (guanine(745)-N(1))-methyltransferase [Methylococcales bacterium]